MREDSKKYMKSKSYWIILGIIIVGGLVYLSLQPASAEITTFEECMEAGNPAMESHPRQCRDPKSDRTFTEIISEVPIQPPAKSPTQPIVGTICDDYTFSTCPANCSPKCVSSSTGGGDFSLTDCEGPGSCVAK